MAPKANLFTRPFNIEYAIHLPLRGPGRRSVISSSLADGRGVPPEAGTTQTPSPLTRRTNATRVSSGENLVNELSRFRGKGLAGDQDPFCAGIAVLHNNVTAIPAIAFRSLVLFTLPAIPLPERRQS